MKRIIVSFADGRKTAGKNSFFSMQKATFPLDVEIGEEQTEIQTISLKEVKKIEFLKKEIPSTSTIHYETIHESTFAGPVAYKLVVEFLDGELLTGSAMKYHPWNEGFFLIPLNPADPSERIYVNSRYIKRVDKKRLLGKQLVDEQVISDNQLKEALQIQAEHRNKKIGSIMLEETFINHKQLDESLHRQSERKNKLGELLLESGYITPEQLKKALRIQKEYRQKRLGQILVELKYLTPNDICLAVASQLDYAWVDLSNINIPDEIIDLLPEETIKKYEVIPVEKRSAGILIVASAQPQDLEKQKVLASLTHYKLEFVVAFDGYIADLICMRFPDFPPE